MDYKRGLCGRFRSAFLICGLVLSFASVGCQETGEGATKEDHSKGSQLEDGGGDEAASPSLAKQLKGVSSELSEAEDAVAEAQGELAGAQERMDTFTAELGRLRESAADAKSSVRQFAGRVAALNESFEVATANAQDLSRQVSAFREELAEAKKQREKLESLVESLLAELKQTRQEVEALKQPTTAPASPARPASAPHEEPRPTE